MCVLSYLYATICILFVKVTYLYLVNVTQK